MPTSPATPDSIIALLIEHDILSTEDPILADSDLFTLGLDSLALMQLLLHLEARFKVAIPVESITAAHFTTPERLAGWIREMQGE
jgi:acyl carrier protein